MPTEIRRYAYDSRLKSRSLTVNKLSGNEDRKRGKKYMNRWKNGTPSKKSLSRQRENWMNLCKAYSKLVEI